MGSKLKLAENKVSSDQQKSNKNSDNLYQYHPTQPIFYAQSGSVWFFRNESEDPNELFKLGGQKKATEFAKLLNEWFGLYQD